MIRRKIRALAVNSPTRSAAFPDVPTMDEVGVGSDKQVLDQINAQTLEKIKADHVKWGQVVKQANIKAE